MISSVSSFVIHYVIEEQTTSTGKTLFVNEKQGHKYLGLVSNNKFKLL